MNLLRHRQRAVTSTLPHPGNRKYAIPASGRLETAVIFGDSVTGQNNINADREFTMEGYWHWFAGLSGGATRLIANAGIGGNVTAEMLARVQTDVIDLAPDYCIVLGGINDIGQSLPAAGIIDNLRQIYQQIQAAGIILFPCTQFTATHWTVSNRLVMDEVNDFNRSYPARFIDFYTAMLDPNGSNQQIKPGATFDTLHPSPRGAQILGREVNRTIRSLVRGRWPLAVTQTDAINILVNPLMAGTGGTLGANATGVVADDWTVDAGGTDAIVSAKDDDDQGMVLTVTASGEQFATVTGGAALQGELTNNDFLQSGLLCSTDSSAGEPVASVELRVLLDDGSNFREFNGAATTLNRTPFPNEDDVTNFLVLTPNPLLNINPNNSAFQIRLHVPGPGTYVFRVGQATARLNG